MSHATKRAALLASRAATMRHDPSPPEAILWAALVSRKLDGVAFRRQVTIAGYICDFVAAKCKLIVEVDGAHHQRQRAADTRRDRKLQRLGYRVLRIEAQLVMRRLPEALERVREALDAPPL
ncbi:MAG: DUF559 domain-containing protein [Polyangiaceae bacterium]|nr:DUF559 domain-containing protein [Polyangiaceae bacterium]